ncbi:MAG: phage tail protein [Cypionkella sp.]
MAIFTAIAGYITTTLVGLGLSTFIAGAVANIAIGAALMGIGQIASSAMGGSSGGRPQTSTPQAQATLNQSTGTRIRGYGIAKLGGTRAFWDSNSAILRQVVMAHHGEIDEFVQFYVGDIAVAIDGGDDVITPPFYGYVRIASHVGTDDQAADAIMLSAWPGVWTSAHRLLGIAYWSVTYVSPPATDYQAVFPEGYNTQVRCICRLSKVFDPRDGAQSHADATTWTWSDNAGLCILDYLTHPDGYNRSVDDIDLPSFEAFSDLCDEPVALAAGGTEPRYRLWGVYGLTDDPQDVLAKMRATCDAEFYQTAAGKIAIRGGKWEAPTVTIRDSDVVGHSLEQGNNRFAAFNELKILYTSPAHDYQTMEATSWENLADQAERGVLTSSLNLDMVPSPSQARRLAKIHIAKSNPEWKGTVSANLSALDALGERTVRAVLPELSIDDAFYVASFAIRPDLTGVEIGIMSINEEAYSWTTAEEGASPPIPEDTRPELTFPVPEIVDLSEANGVITVEVADPDRTDLELHGQIRAGAGSLWQEMETDGLTAAFGPVAPDVTTTYQVRVRWLGPLETAGVWSALEEIEIEV